MTASEPPAQATTVFERMSRLAQETGALNLGQGFPDMADPPELIAAAQRALGGHSNQYPPMRGLAELRQAIAQWYAREQGIPLADDEIVVTSGGTEALASAIFALVRPGDEVILVQPLYDAYAPLIQRAGGIVRLVDTAPPEWQLRPGEIERAIGPRTRAIVLNTPNNPTGTTIDRAGLEAVGALCERHDLTLICDEVWEATLLDGGRHVSALHVPALRNRTVKVGSAGKIFSLTGWKVGWVIAAPHLANAIAAQHQFITFTTAPPLQRAVAEGLCLPQSWFADHRARYRAAREQLTAGLAGAGYVTLPARGTWFVLIDLAASGLPADDLRIAEALVRTAGIATIPVSAFFAARAPHGFLRLCFAKREETLSEAVARLAAFRDAMA